MFDDLNFTSRPYVPFLAYGQSKTANILFAVEATNRWAAEAIFANAVHPGGIAATKLSRHMDPDVFTGMLAAGTFVNKSIEQGAATSVLVVSSLQLEGIGGRYFEDCHEAEVIDSGATDLSEHRHGVAPYALDPGNAKHLWDVSLDLLA